MTAAKAATAAAMAQPRVGECLTEGSNISLTAGFADASVADHELTDLTITLQRTVSCDPEQGIDFTVTLPAPLQIASWQPTNSCGGVAEGPVGGQTVTLADGELDDGVTSCTVVVSVMSEQSGTYTVNAASVTGLVNVGSAVTPQQLVVTTAPPSVRPTFTPVVVNAKVPTTLKLTLALTDTLSTAVAGGLGFGLNLPSALKITSGTTTNTCGGTLTAPVGGSLLSYSGGTVSNTNATCSFSFPLVSSVAGTYTLTNNMITAPSGIRARLGCKERIEAPCGAMLKVNALAQTIAFAQPVDWSQSKGKAPLGGTSTSQLTITYSSSTPSVCTVDGQSVVLKTQGTCSITAAQEGDSTYKAADEVTRSFTVGPPTPAPGEVTAAAGVSSLRATWQVPGDVTGVTGYTAIASPGPATCSTKSAADTSCVLGGQAGVEYTITVVSNHPLGDSAATGPSNPATPTDPPVAATPPVTNLLLTTDKGTITTAEPNQDIVIIGYGFAPYSTATIVIYSTPTVLGTVVTDGAGNFSKAVKVPASLSVGGHSLVASGVDSHGNPHNLKMAVTVAADTEGLAVTGAPIAAILQTGLVTTFVGGGLVLAGRSRRRS
jgi:titin